MIAAFDEVSSVSCDTEDIDHSMLVESGIKDQSTKFVTFDSATGTLLI